MFDDIVAGMDDAAPLREALAKREDYRGEFTDGGPSSEEMYFGILTYVGEHAVVTVGNPLFHSLEKGLLYIIKTGQVPPRFLSTVVAVGDKTVRDAVRENYRTEKEAAAAGDSGARERALLDLIPVIKGHGTVVDADNPFGLHDEWVESLRRGEMPQSISLG